MVWTPGVTTGADMATDFNALDADFDALLASFAADVNALIAAYAVFTAVAKGLVPASGGGTANFLRADGTWAAPAGSGSGDVVGPASSLDNALARFDALTGKLLQNSGVLLTDDGELLLPEVDPPTTPSAGVLNLFARKLANRMLPAFMGPSGLQSSLQPLLARNKVMWAAAHGNSAQISLFGLPTPAATGTALALNVAVTNIFTAMRSVDYGNLTAATNVAVGWRLTVVQFFRGDPSNLLGGFFATFRFGRTRGAAANATMRGFTGFASTTSAPTDVEVSTGFSNLLGVGTDAADTNWQIMYRTGTGTTVKVDTGIPKSVANASEMYDLTIFARAANNDVSFMFTRLSDGLTFEHTTTTDLPAATTLLSPRGHFSVGGTSADCGYALSSLYIETDN